MRLIIEIHEYEDEGPTPYTAQELKDHVEFTLGLSSSISNSNSLQSNSSAYLSFTECAEIKIDRE